MTSLTSCVKLEHTAPVYTSAVCLISHILSWSEDSFPAADIHTEILWAVGGLEGGKKGLISPSLVKKKQKKPTINIPLIALLQHIHWRTHIQLTCCKVSWKTDVAGVTYRILLMAFHCLTFPFTHSNPLTMELRDVVNDGAPRELEESGSLSRWRVDGAGALSAFLLKRPLALQSSVRWQGKGWSYETRWGMFVLCWGFSTFCLGCDRI